MPALYAHDRFGKEVAGKMDGELKEIISKYYKQFRIGLQGPDILFFYRPFYKNEVAKCGTHLHEISAYPFFEHALDVVREAGRDSREYAYLMGFICHFILDSECHPYVAQMIEKTGVAHLEIEEEYEKMLLRLDGKDPFSYPLARLVPADTETAKAIAPFYEGIDWMTVRKSLRWLCFIKRLFTAPRRWKHDLLNLIMKVSGQAKEYKGLMHQRKDNERCVKSSLGLFRRMHQAVDVAVQMIYSFDESVQCAGELGEGGSDEDRADKCGLNKRFDRTFE